MTKKKPWEYQSAFSEDRLSVIAQALLDVYHGVQEELSTELDTNYTRGTTTFGRQKSMLIQMYQSGRHKWFDLLNTNNDLTCAIGGIPFRFFCDDHVKPHKRGFWKRNDQDNLFPTDGAEPIYWRFIVEKPIAEDGDASVYFIGANIDQDVVCEWKYAEAVRVLKSVDGTRHEAVDNPEPEVGLPKQDKEKDSDSSSE